MKVRHGWLKFMYAYTIAGAGGLGLGILVLPEMVKSIFRWPADEPVSLGIVGCIYLVFGVLSVLGLRSPMKFVPLLMFQLCYKVIWFAAVMTPLLFSHRLPGYAVMLAAIFATYIVGDLIAIPFRYIFAENERTASD